MRRKSKAITIISSSYPPLLGGSSTVVYNLAQNLTKAGYEVSIITKYPHKGFKKEKDSTVKVYYLFRLSRIVNRSLERYVRYVTYVFNWLKAFFVIKKISPDVVIGVYPDHMFLELGMTSTKMAGKKFIPYLHDTLVEALGYTKYKNKALELQKKLFANGEIIVISDGMQELYRQKYNMKTSVLCHTLTEGNFIENTLESNCNDIKNSIFWGGNIYNINKNAIQRISHAISETEMELEISNTQSYKHLNAMGLSSDNYKKMYYSDSDYNTNLKKQGLLLIALDYPDESPVHPDELSTIFPTKTIEYLLSGRPILVHAPENYFITKFFKEHNCGYICSSRDTLELSKAINAIKNDEMIAEVVQNARKVASSYFNPKSGINKLQEKNII
ncbi:hypothetical protein EMN47_01990 [Prolixibacteraceae bacterium JC049]|nr:hypothetical protein [Prolixibacteraceae bacterium JC049]